MAYTLNKSSSPALITITDESLDDTFGLTFVGRNRGEWGEAINENFVRLMENFAGVAPPTNSIEGQLFFDTASKDLKVFDGTTYVPVINDIDGGFY